MTTKTALLHTVTVRIIISINKNDNKHAK